MRRTFDWKWWVPYALLVILIPLTFAAGRWYRGHNEPLTVNMDGTRVIIAPSKCDGRLNVFRDGQKSVYRKTDGALYDAHMMIYKGHRGFLSGIGLKEIMLTLAAVFGAVFGPYLAFKGVRGAAVFKYHHERLNTLREQLSAFFKLAFEITLLARLYRLGEMSVMNEVSQATDDAKRNLSMPDSLEPALWAVYMEQHVNQITEANRKLNKELQRRRDYLPLFDLKMQELNASMVTVEMSIDPKNEERLQWVDKLRFVAAKCSELRVKEDLSEKDCNVVLQLREECIRYSLSQMRKELGAAALFS